jgi:molecular chaperone DnaJ
LKIPPETQTGKLFRLRGKGVKSLRGGHKGDCFCKVVLETPVHLTKEQKQLLEKLEQSCLASNKHSPKEKGWLQSVKSFFEEMKF